MAGITLANRLVRALTSPARSFRRLDPSRRRALGLGLALAVAGTTATFLVMANEGRLPRGPLWGAIALLVAVAGLLVVMDAPGRPKASLRSLHESSLFPRAGEAWWMAPVFTLPFTFGLAVTAPTLVRAAGVTEEALPPLLIAALLPLFASSLRRPLLFVLAFAAALYIPFLGAYGLLDPWETHYAEVAREILARNDWISLWWAHEGWFWSKPILLFWLEALSMGALGVDYLPDAHPEHAEWAIRLPHALLSLGALATLYLAVSRVWSPRAGLFCALVLSTAPYYALITRQAITDLPFVTCMTMAMSILVIALVSDPEEEVTAYRLGPLSLSARHLLLGGLVLCILPQALYLITRNVTWLGGPFAWHADLFTRGSAGNGGIPGNPAEQSVAPYFSGLAAQPAFQGSIWLAVLFAILTALRVERRTRALAMAAFYLFCGLAFIAKGIPGFALPGLIALLYLIASARWSLLFGGQLRLSLGVLIVSGIGLPWYVAMYVRHGPPFTQRLLIHDHINRLTTGVHGDTGSIGYFIEQLGYGLFPWVALLPLALAGQAAVRRYRAAYRRPPFVPSGPARLLSVEQSPQAERAHRNRAEIYTLYALWAAAAFTLFSAMTTKFHHYIFPAVPAIAVLVGLALCRMVEPEASLVRGPTGKRWKTLAGWACAGLSPAPAIVGIAGLYGDVRGIVPAQAATEVDWVLQHPWPATTCAALLGGFALLFTASVWLLRPPPPRTGLASGTAVAGLVAGAILVGVVGRDLSWATATRPQGYEHFLLLFIYQYARPWPPHLDYRPILTGFAIVATGITLLAALRPLRRAAAYALVGTATICSIWTLDVYLPDLAPHWSQRELIDSYYEARTGPEQPLLAWQMNWKGENFYTGNRVHTFVSLDNTALLEWVRAHPNQTVFFLLEHGRLSNLRGILRRAVLEALTTRRDCNKFVLVKARLPSL